MDTTEYAMFCYDTVEVENSLKRTYQYQKRHYNDSFSFFNYLNIWYFDKWHFI